MKHFTRVFLAIVLLVKAGTLFSQSFAIGDWREHLPYNNCISVTEAGSQIYAATPYGLFHYDRTDNSVARLTKVNGLSDIGLSKLAYSNAFKTLIVTYANANIDLIHEGKITNLPDIKRKAILGNKTIYKAVIYDQYAYLCCGFGLVVVDLDRMEIKDTYYLGPDGSPLSIYDLVSDGLRFYVATENGIYHAPVNSPNLSNYASWTHDESNPHPDGKYNSITLFKNQLVTNLVGLAYNTDTLFIQHNGSWGYVEKPNSSTRHAVQAFGDQLMVVNVDNVELKDTNLNLINRVYTYILDDTNYAPQPLDATLSEDGHLWIADQAQGLVENFNTWGFNRVLLNGPSGVKVFDMDISGGHMVAVPGGRNSSWGSNWDGGAVYYFKEGSWASAYRQNDQGLDTIRDFVTVAVDPTNPDHVYAGSWGWGLAEFLNGKKINVFNGTNSTLLPPSTYPNWNAWIGGLAFDGDNNLWVANSSSANVLSVRKYSNGEWKSFNLGQLYPGATAIDMGAMIIDNYNQKWVLLRGKSLLVYTDNYTLDNPNDDRAKILTNVTNQGNIPGARVLSIACDKEGQVWLGTDEGVAVFYAPESVFSGQNYDAQRVFITIGGYTQYLLETEAVTAIAVDGANRKWFGTERAGVFLMSADGSKQLFHFTAEDSPLLSNSISCITIDPESGEVFFGTDKGIVSYKGTATEGGETNSNVLVYPNPVEPGYDGAIAIKGLVKNASVKVTDISGTMIYQTVAEGGQAIWNGRNFDGRRASTGVYLVFITNEDGSETNVSKILFKN